MIIEFNTCDALHNDWVGIYEISKSKSPNDRLLLNHGISNTQNNKLTTARMTSKIVAREHYVLWTRRESTTF
jgi:hypothetical protein